MQTVSDRVRAKKAKLSGEGEQVVSILQKEYGMSRYNAVRLAHRLGPLFASTMLSKSITQTHSPTRHVYTNHVGKSFDLDQLVKKIRDLGE